jgi:hypothetical protein
MLGEKSPKGCCRYPDGRGDRRLTSYAHAAALEVAMTLNTGPAPEMERASKSVFFSY